MIKQEIKFPKNRIIMFVNLNDKLYCMGVRLNKKSILGRMLRSTGFALIRTLMIKGYLTEKEEAKASWRFLNGEVEAIRKDREIKWLRGKEQKKK